MVIVNQAAFCRVVEILITPRDNEALDRYARIEWRRNVIRVLTPPAHPVVNLLNRVCDFRIPTTATRKELLSSRLQFDQKNAPIRFCVLKNEIHPIRFAQAYFRSDLGTVGIQHDGIRFEKTVKVAFAGPGGL